MDPLISVSGKWEGSDRPSIWLGELYINVVLEISGEKRQREENRDWWGTCKGCGQSGISGGPEECFWEAVRR